MLTKETRRLFQGQYQYKAVLVCPAAGWFRGRNVSEALDKIKENGIGAHKNPFNKVKTPEDFDYCMKLAKTILKMSNFNIRVESPFISIYSNSEKDVKALAKLDTDRVKYISRPPLNSTLTSDTILLPKVNFEYRVTLGKTTQDNSTFVQWANNNKKLKLTKSCIRDLTKDRSWGGTYFYVTGDNNLLMTKMHLGGSINKVERIIKA